MVIGSQKNVVFSTSQNNGMLRSNDFSKIPQEISTLLKQVEESNEETEHAIKQDMKYFVTLANDAYTKRTSERIDSRDESEWAESPNAIANHRFSLNSGEH